jgi:hypothetical protein
MNPHGEKAKYWPRLRESNKDGLDLRSARPMNNIHLPGLFCQEKDQDRDQMLNSTPPASRTKSNDRIGMQSVLFLQSDLFRDLTSLLFAVIVPFIQKVLFSDNNNHQI